MLNDLHSLLATLPPLAVAFSGGLDSRFLCAVCLDRKNDVLAVHVTGPHIPVSETAGARAFARDMGLPYAEIFLNPLGISEVAHNDPLRCYYCKKHIMQGIRQHLAMAGEAGRILCDGSNEDDQAKYRPGLKALAEEHVLSPLAMAHLTKKAITEQAQGMGFPLPLEKARPCLLTRFDYGLSANADDLLRLGKAEEALFAMHDAAGQRLFPDFRLRLTPAPLLQVLSWKEEWHKAVAEILATCGFPSFEVCVTGTISGYFDAKRNGILF